MSRLHEEDQIRELFQELKAETEATGRVPDFEVMLGRAKSGATRRAPVRIMPPSRRMIWAGGWASAAIAAGIVGLMITRTGSEGDEAFEQLVAAFSADASAGAWVSPTAELLEVPGLELIRRVPSFGATLPGQPEVQPEDITEEEREGRP